ncbi:MAG TPA: O-antigen ligase family protein [Acidisoma sp.]|nr:O-antigen ligase family protein [Acidisoma sp.]
MDDLFWPAFGLAAILAGFGLAWFAPDSFWPALALAPASLLVAWAAAFPHKATVLWLLVIATCPEMWLADLLRLPDPEPVIGLDKAVGLVLVLLCVLRYGPRLPLANPALAFPAMAAVGVLHGLWPGLTAMDSVRSLAGSVAPFAFSFARLSTGWCRAVIRSVIVAPFVILGFGACLAAAGLRPLYILEDGALRLGASGHPAFLAGFTLTSLYALLLELVRERQRFALVLLSGDLMILLATGARAPLALAAVLIFLVTAFVRAPAWPWAARIPLLLAGFAAPALAVFAAPLLGFVRLLSLAEQGDMTSLSNRNLIWPVYEAAFLRSPWFGWGTGAGKIVVPVGTPLWHLLGTNAAHNEYLRIAVEGGGFGLALLLLLFILWWQRGLRGMSRPERQVMILVLLAFGVHSATDNTLIATTASLLFAWVSAVFARAEREAEGGLRS